MRQAHNKNQLARLQTQRLTTPKQDLKVNHKGKQGDQEAKPEGKQASTSRNSLRIGPTGNATGVSSQMKSNNGKKISQQKKENSTGKNSRPHTTRTEENQENQAEIYYGQAVSEQYYRKSKGPVDRVSREVSPEKYEILEEIRISWQLFEKSANLGQGAFGDVLKIKCLKSTCLSKDGTCRIVMSSNAVRKAKQARQKAEVAAGRNAAISNDYEKSMFQDEYYVAKTINVAHLSQKAQFEALNEIETMQTLNSPYIVGYYDSFIDEELSEPQINIIIEYCAGGDLSSFLEKQEKANASQPHQKYLNENLVWRIFINLCIGLEHMHSRDFIHRDLKTLNIFMTKDNVAKIGDLGCALNLKKHRIKMEQKKLEKQKSKANKQTGGDRIMEDIEQSESMLNEKSLNDSMLLKSLKSTFERHSRLNQFDESSMTDDNPVGTPYYLAPEIWREKKYSKESDIWALGVILYELLHYKKPFPANDKDELIEKVYNKPFNKIRSGISTPLQHLINIMLKKDPSKRPSIEEIVMSDEFQSITAKQKIQLPLQLNKQKILQKIATDQLGDICLTPFQKALFDKEIKRAQKIGQKVEKAIVVTKKLNSNQTTQVSRAALLSHKNSSTEITQGSMPKQKSGKLTKNNSRANHGVNAQSDMGANSLQMHGKQKIPKLNLNQIKFSENLKGIADIQVIEETKGQRQSSKKMKNNTSRSPMNKVRKSVEIRKNNTERSDSRIIMKRNLSKKEERSVVSQHRNKNQYNQSGSLIGNKSEIFSKRRQSVNQVKGKSKIDMQALKGLDSDRIHDITKKADFFYGNQKAFTVKNSQKPSRQTSPKQGIVLGSHAKTIFTMKVPSHFQQSSSKGNISQYKKSTYSQKQSPRSIHKSRKNSQTFHVDDILAKRRNTEKQDREQIHYGRMDIEDSINLKVNDTILTHINDQMKDQNSRNLVNHAATSKIEESADLINNDFASNHSSSSKGITTLNRKYVSVRNERDENKQKLSSHDEEFAGNNSQSIIKQDQIDLHSQGAVSKHPNINAITKRKINANKPVQSTFQQSHTVNQTKVTNMNVDKRKYLSKYTEAQMATEIQSKNMKKSVTPEMYSEQSKKHQGKQHQRKDSTLNNFDVNRAKRTESVFLNINETNGTISPKIITKSKANEFNEKQSQISKKQQIITPNRKVPTTSSLYQKPLVQKKRSAGLNTGGLTKEKPLHKQAVSKIRQSAKVTSTFDEKYSKRIGQKKNSTNSTQNSMMGQRIPNHNYSEYSIKNERHNNTLNDGIQDYNVQKHSFQANQRMKLQAQAKSELSGANSVKNSQIQKNSNIQKCININIPRPSSNSSKLSIKNNSVPLKQDVFKKANLEQQEPASKKINSETQDKDQKELTAASTVNRPVGEPLDEQLLIEDVADTGDEKTFQPRAVNNAKLIFDKYSQEINSHKLSLVKQGVSLPSKNKNENITKSFEPRQAMMPESTPPDFFSGTSKPPLSIMIDKLEMPEDDQNYTQNSKNRPLTPGGYLLNDNEEQVDDLPNKYDEGPKSSTHLGEDGVKTPNEGTNKRFSRKTFQAFQKFKNAFKNPRSKNLSSQQDSHVGSKSCYDNQHADINTPQLEGSESPEQLREKTSKDVANVTDFNGMNEKYHNDQEDLILKLSPKNQQMNHVGVTQNQVSDTQEQEFAFKQLSDSDKDKEEYSKSQTFPNDDIEFSSLRHMSHVGEDSLQFDKIV